MAVDFLYKTSKLQASFRILSKVPADSIPDWDFGDNKGKSNELFPTYTYEASGFYTVTLTIDDLVINHLVIVTEYANTHLTDSIYCLIDKYIPSEMLLEMSSVDKMSYINKWQLYLQPLVNHTIPIEEYSNELYYEGLENQLIMELAVYDYIYTNVTNLLLNTGNSLHNKANGYGSDSKVKQITTGPSEVQFFEDITEAQSSLLKVYSTAIQPGGIIDNIKANICMLATRLDIYLPICRKPVGVKVVPKVVNHRDPGILGGPNPGSIINHSEPSLIPE
jgi:hypothetical protein